jgi:D-3-phosphoglycerate dehydrogenase / 2-oxoglutarate reductase
MSEVLICTSSFSKEHPEFSILSDHGIGCQFNPYSRKLTTEELLELLTGKVVGIISGLEKITGEVIHQSRELKVISRCGIGSDNIDEAQALEKGIEIFVTPDAPTQAVAELTLALILSVLRKITEQHNSMVAGNWSRKMGGLLSGKTVGIIGFGRIGQRVAKLLSVFDAVVKCYDIHPVESSYAEYVSDLEELVSESDIISLHLAITDKTKSMINRALLGKMKKNVLLVNTARGELINEGDLEKFLVENKQSFAALDVFKSEPYEGNLRNLPNVILTPHVGSFAKEARMQMEKESLQNLIKGLKNAGVIHD